VITNNAQYGIEFDPSAAANASFLRVQMLGNQFGFYLKNFNASGTAVAASLEDSVIASNTNTGLHVQSTSNNVATTTVNLSNSQVFNNKLGLNADSGTINLEQVTLFGSGAFGGYQINGNQINGMGVINTFVTPGATTYNGNYIVDTNNSGTLTQNAPQ
jgi:hypothetical protein